MNDLYTHEWSLLQNHFCPSMKLLEKKKVGSRYQRKYGKPKTPYARTIASSDVEKAIKEQHLSLNPFALKAEIERKLKAIFANDSVTSKPVFYIQALSSPITLPFHQLSLTIYLD